MNFKCWRMLSIKDQELNVSLKEVAKFIQNNLIERDLLNTALKTFKKNLFQMLTKHLVN